MGSSIAARKALSPVGHDFDRFAMRAERPGEEPARGQEVALG